MESRHPAPVYRAPHGLAPAHLLSLILTLFRSLPASLCGSFSYSLNTQVAPQPGPLSDMLPLCLAPVDNSDLNSKVFPHQPVEQAPSHHPLTLFILIAFLSCSFARWHVFSPASAGM